MILQVYNKTFGTFNVQLYGIAHYYQHWINTLSNKECMEEVLKINPILGV